jgi:hypothetical protein
MIELPNRHGAKMRRLRLFLLSLLSRTLLNPFSEPLVILLSQASSRWKRRHSSAPPEHALFGSLPPMFGVIENVRRHERPAIIDAERSPSDGVPTQGACYANGEGMPIQRRNLPQAC